MQIAILGTGNVGQALGAGWAARGWSVAFGSRDPHSEKAQALQAAGFSVLETAAAVAAADLVVLATPWAATQAVVQSIADWSGKIIVDATNPLAPGLQLAVGHTTSGAELIAGWAPGARVVKAFNTTGFNNMQNPLYDGQASTLLIAGDDAQAKAAVAQLAEALGFEAVDLGPLATARYLEPLAMIWITLAMRQGYGREIAFKLLQRR